MIHGCLMGCSAASPADASVVHLAYLAHWSADRLPPLGKFNDISSVLSCRLIWTGEETMDANRTRDSCARNMTQSRTLRSAPSSRPGEVEQTRRSNHHPVR